MFVDVSNLLRDKNVKRTISVWLLGDEESESMDDFGVIIPENSTFGIPSIENLSCGMVEKRDKVLSPKDGTYLDQVTYDFYIPMKTLKEYDFTGATIIDNFEDRYVVTTSYFKGNYGSHGVVNATLVKNTGGVV